jgi:hypothetical protein
MAGELISAPGQLEWDGMLFGDGYDGPGIYFERETIDGLEDMPNMRGANIERARDHGALLGPHYAGEVAITVNFRLVGAPYIPEQIAALERACMFRQDEQPLAWDFGAGPRMRYCRVARRSLPVDIVRRRGGTAVAVVQWVATDPRIYGTTLHTASTGPGVTIGGMGFPHGFPHGMGETTSGTAYLSNAGTVGAPWTATIVGPVASPRLRLLDMDGELAMDGFSLGVGDTLTFDSLERTVLLNGTASRYGALTVRDWFDIPPGGSSLAFMASSGSGSLSLAWRSTWL